MTAMLVEERTTTNDAPEESAHIVRIPAHLEGKTTPQAYVMEARVMGTPVQALCGYTWVPQKNPEALPVCSKCLELYNYRNNGEEGDDTPDA